MRVVKTSAQGTTAYHYDKEGRVITETDNNGNLISDFVYANGKLVAKLAPTTVYFYHTDPAGTPLAMTDASGTVVWHADYLPFGEENLISGTLENDFRFVGKENDKETGLYYFGARYMEAMIGRFISTDPVGVVDSRTGGINGKGIHNPQRINLYAYGLNNPYRYIDPDGNEDYNITGSPLFGGRFKRFLSNPSWSTFRDLWQDPFGPILPSNEGIEEGAQGFKTRLPPRGTLERDAIEAARTKGIAAKQKQELEDIRAGGKGSGVFSDSETEEIRRTGEFPKGTQWHHDPTVANRPDLASDPRSVHIIRGDRKQHRIQGHQVWCLGSDQDNPSIL